MFEYLTERLASAPPKRVVKLDVETRANSATIRLGEKSFQLSSDIDISLAHDNFDFALFGAAAVALRNNWDIETDLPISSEAIAAVRSTIDYLDMWRVRRCYPVNLFCTNIVSPMSRRKKGGIICLSGGVDSTYAAFDKAKNGEISYGLLIAGADYPSRSHPGFIDLRNRVKLICGRIGINAITAETTIREFKLYWPISHIFVLAMSLSFHCSRFARAYIAADFTPSQEYGYHPWGNSRPLVEALGSTSFPIAQAGQDIGRTAKLACIAREHPRLLHEISVCYVEKGSGGNCGVCEKCVRTKLNLAASRIPFEGYFAENPELTNQLHSLSLPNTQAGLRRHMVFLKDIQSSMPEGALRNALEDRLSSLRSRITPLGKV